MNFFKDIEKIYDNIRTSAIVHLDQFARPKTQIYIRAFDSNFGWESGALEEYMDYEFEDTFDKVIFAKPSFYIGAMRALIEELDIINADYKDEEGENESNPTMVIHKGRSVGPSVVKPNWDYRVVKELTKAINQMKNNVVNNALSGGIQIAEDQEVKHTHWPREIEIKFIEDSDNNTFTAEIIDKASDLHLEYVYRPTYHATFEQGRLASFIGLYDKLATYLYKTAAPTLTTFPYKFDLERGPKNKACLILANAIDIQDIIKDYHFDLNSEFKLNRVLSDIVKREYLGTMKFMEGTFEIYTEPFKSEGIAATLSSSYTIGEPRSTHYLELCRKIKGDPWTDLKIPGYPDHTYINQKPGFQPDIYPLDNQNLPYTIGTTYYDTVTSTAINPGYKVSNAEKLEKFLNDYNDEIQEKLSYNSDLEKFELIRIK